MKKFLSAFVAILICTGFAFGQTANDVVFSFVRKDKEKIFQKKEDGSRFANFAVSGIKSDEQALTLANSFKKSDLVVDFTISDEIGANQRNATVNVVKGAKFEQLRDLLIANGVAYVKMNDKTTPVSMLKSKAERRESKTSSGPASSH